ncbi:DinB family protein [Ruania alkalisoli]|uniref:DinB family protein n=1 Tax=Ruania alkalisoli TaxID=2779775 RepID=A0A7M1SVK9_9MICO|nr:DinB family protein [Ruania alkalisoli]QOR71004.1 DinB family protein [Ruania alkalisoli]
MTESTMATVTTELTGERGDLLHSLTNARHFLRFTARDLTDEQARTRTTVSELTIGGLIKHVCAMEAQWADFTVNGKANMEWEGTDFSNIPPEVLAQFAQGFQMLPEETLAGVLDRYAEIAARTDEVLAGTDLDLVQELPQAPWFTDTAWSNRRVFLHIIAETAQHAGHADIIRESLDGAKSMG